MCRAFPASSTISQANHPEQPNGSEMLDLCVGKKEITNRCIIIKNYILIFVECLVKKAEKNFGGGKQA